MTVLNAHRHSNNNINNGKCHNIIIHKPNYSKNPNQLNNISSTDYHNDKSKRSINNHSSSSNNNDDIPHYASNQPYCAGLPQRPAVNRLYGATANNRTVIVSGTTQSHVTTRMPWAPALQFDWLRLAMMKHTPSLRTGHIFGTSGVANKLLQVQLGACCRSGFAALNMCAFVCAACAILVPAG